jgi:hypothetical protein
VSKICRHHGGTQQITEEQEAEGQDDRSRKEHSGIRCERVSECGPEQIKAQGDQRDRSRRQQRAEGVSYITPHAQGSSGVLRASSRPDQQRHNLFLPDSVGDKFGRIRREKFQVAKDWRLVFFLHWGTTETNWKCSVLGTTGINEHFPAARRIETMPALPGFHDHGCLLTKQNCKST